MGLRAWWKERKRRFFVRLNASVLRRLARWGGHYWMAAYMVILPAIALVLLLAALLSNVSDFKLLLDEPSLMQRSTGWLRLAGLPLAIITVGLWLYASWTKALRDLKERPRRKKLARDYDRTALRQIGGDPEP